jgi:two-component system nitrogen regulation response regulator GlnG
MQEVYKAVGRVAPQDMTVLILGESGTGKELVARALYLHSRRADGPFLAVNCAAIPEPLLESEMFGHERGAFTGADRRRIGKFEQCDGGTLFLDEIGDMPLALQAKMLRVLQDQRFERVGGTETVQTRVRLIAATNQDPEAAVAAGRFRPDLYYRLKGATVRVPPLRERAGDVSELAHHFLFRFNRELGTTYRGFDPRVLEWLQRHTWPGNVRELQGVVREAMLYGSGHVILPEFLPDQVRQASASAAEPASARPSELQVRLESVLEDGAGDSYRRAVEALDRFLLPRALKRAGGNQTQASELLGLSRGTLRQKLRDLGLSADRPPAEPTGE